jgi:thiamine-phosphate pyrophosphorylase
MAMNDAHPQLYLTIDTGPTADAQLAAVLARCPGIAAILISRVTSKQEATVAQALVRRAQSANVAALFEGDAKQALLLHADGVHLPWSPTLRADFDEAREILGNHLMIGVAIDPAAETARHDAMEIAEAGADYIGFSAGDAQPELVAWWAQIFEIPCVAFDVADADAARASAALGTEFIATPIPSAASPAQCVAHVRGIGSAIVGVKLAGARS